MFCDFCSARWLPVPRPSSTVSLTSGDTPGHCSSALPGLSPSSLHCRTLTPRSPVLPARPVSHPGGSLCFAVTITSVTGDHNNP